MTSKTKGRLFGGVLVASLAINLGLLGYMANSGALERILLRLDLVDLPYKPDDFQIHDLERFRLLPNTAAEVVFAGDSLINNGPWAEFYSEIHNRGIGGERTDGLLERLDEILESHPKQVFLLIGSNDLSMAVPRAQILRNYRSILEQIRKDSPTTKTVVIGVLPVNRKFKDPSVYTNETVASLNESLQKLVGEFPTARFVDLRTELIDDKGDLKPELSKDGLHLNVRGYLAVKDKIRSFLDQP